MLSIIADLQQELQKQDSLQITHYPISLQKHQKAASNYATGKKVWLVGGDAITRGLFRRRDCRREKRIIKKIHIVHGGPDYDSLYTEGIPSSVSINHDDFGKIDGGRCLFQLGHAR